MLADGRYHPSDDQRALADTLDESFADILPLARLHVSAEETDGAWSELDALGSFGISLSEEMGGSGLGAVEEALIVIALGRRLASPTVLASLGAAPALRAADGVRDGPTPRVAAAYRHDGEVIVIDDASADLLLVREQAGAAVYAAARPFAVVDDRYWTGRLQRATRLGEPVARLDAGGLLRLRLLDAAALAGLADAALAMALGYAKMREQFGRAIGSFQAVKHICADMAIAARCAQDQTSFAAVALEKVRPDAEQQVESALLVAGTAALQNSAKNVQIHGGIGFSDEANPHLLVKRAQLLATLAGGMEAATERLANLKESPVE